MYVPESLKLNKFRLCNLPSARNLFAKLGIMSVGSDNQYTGDLVPDRPGTKTDIMADMLERDRILQQEEADKKND